MLFSSLLELPTTVPLVVQLLNHNIQLITSHLVMRDPIPADSDAAFGRTGWHRDGGTAPADLGTAQPRMFIKISYWLSDISEAGRGAILSELTRKSVFFGYGYRWLRPMDYLAMPEELLQRYDPIRRQLLGDCTSVMGYQLPEADDVPLKEWLAEHTGTEIDRRDEIPALKVVTER